jgi:plastocyanin
LRTLVLSLGCVLAALTLACGGDGTPVGPAAAPTQTSAPEATAPPAPSPTSTPEPTPEPTEEPTAAPQPTQAPATGGGGAGGGSGLGAPSTVTVVAHLLDFTNKSVRARAGSVTIVLDNRDNLVPHNVSIANIGTSPDCTGPCTTRLTFTAGPGTYRFFCTIHPDMVGTLTLVP